MISNYKNNNKSTAGALGLFSAQTNSSSTKKAIVILSAALAFSSASQASEAPTGFYAGVGLANYAAEDSGISSSELGAALIGGYTFSPYINSELSIFSIGNHKPLAMQGNGLSLSIIASYPIIEKISVLAELGAMSVDIDIDESKNIAFVSSEDGPLQDGIDTSLYMSVGAKYQITNWSLAMKLSMVDLDADLNIFSVQARYHF